MNAAFDLVIVRAGLFGAVIAHEARRAGRSRLVLERCEYIAGNCFTETIADIHVHRYRACIFHTEVLDVDNSQGYAVVNRTDADAPHTRNISVLQYGHDVEVALEAAQALLK